MTPQTLILKENDVWKDVRDREKEGLCQTGATRTSNRTEAKETASRAEAEGIKTYTPKEPKRRAES